MKETFDRLIRNKAILAVACIVIGIIMVIMGDNLLRTGISIIGYVLIAAAVAYVVLYLSGKNRDSFQIVNAVLAAVAGILLVTHPGLVANALPIIVGILLILNGVLNLTQGGDSRIPTVLAILMVILGIIVLTHPWILNNIVVRCAGVALILNGLFDLDIIRRI